MPGSKFLRWLCVLFVVLSLSIPVFADETTENRMPVVSGGLTQEQEEEGWIYYNGYAYPPESFFGQSGKYTVSNSEFSNESDLVSITVIADVPSGITSPVIIEFANAETYQEYYVELYASSGYQDTFKISPGAYYFTGGGPTSDSFGVFDVVDPKSFTVINGENITIRPVIRSNGNVVQKLTGYGQEEVIEESSEAEEPVIEEEPQTTTSWITYLLWSLAMFGIVIAMFIIWRVKVRIDNSTDY